MLQNRLSKLIALHALDKKGWRILLTLFERNIVQKAIAERSLSALAAHQATEVIKKLIDNRVNILRQAFLEILQKASRSDLAKDIGQLDLTMLYRNHDLSNLKLDYLILQN